jgi:hypothetical protein
MEGSSFKEPNSTPYNTTTRRSRPCSEFKLGTCEMRIRSIYFCPNPHECYSVGGGLNRICNRSHCTRLKQHWKWRVWGSQCGNYNISWVVTPCSLEKARGFWETYRLHLQGRRVISQSVYRLVMLVPRLAYFSTLNTEVICYSQTSRLSPNYKA